MISVAAVSRRFDSVVAVDDVSFELQRGEFLTILGSSGSGKTTLLRIIAGFIEPDNGEVYIQQQPLSAIPTYKRSIGMVFQRLALFPNMTAEQNIAYPLKMRRFDARTIPDRVGEYLRLVRLEGYGARRIHELSGGQQQRVAIARALVFQPDLLLLDEPLAALDRKLREDMQLEFRRIQQELGVTTINVTHDQREALVMSDRVMVMEGGRMQQLATPVEAYRQPANRFVAGFIGVTNFLPAELLSRAGGQARVRIGGHEFSGRCLDEKSAESTGADCALRAEQIRIATADAELNALDSSLQAHILEAIFEGDRLVYSVQCPALADAVLRVFDHDPTHHQVYASGQTVHIGWNQRDLMVFPH